jgi:1-acyl-sn-glycerol-3-phosphate acyltransferase
VLDTLRRAAGRAPGPLGPVLDIGVSTAGDWFNLVRGAPQGGDIDEWDPHYIRQTLPFLGRLFDVYFRPEVAGLENIPEEGPALLVGNHSGGTMIADTFVFAMAFFRRFGPDRRFHQLAHDVAVAFPTIGAMIRRYGTLSASHENARRAFRAGAPVLVYPGGDYESYRPSWESDKVDFGGRQGFVRLARALGVRIVPVVAIGGQETALFLGRGRRFAKALRLDRTLRLKVLPAQIAPPLGFTLLDLPIRVPLPAKISIRVLPPISLDDDGDAAGDYDLVVGRMQATLDELSDERTLPVLG